METPRVRILSLRKAQLEVSSVRAGRVLRGVERQIGNYEKLAAREHARFEAVRAKVMREKERKDTPSRAQAGVSTLIQSAAAIKRGQDSIQRCRIVLQQRKENSSRVLSVLKKRGELISGELRRVKTRSEESREARDIEYAASVHSLIAAGARSNTENSTPSPAVAVIPLPGPACVPSESEHASGVSGPASAFQVPQQDPASRNSMMTVSYAAGDGSTFEVEVGACGKNLQVCVLSQAEKDRRLLRLHRGGISDALASRGYHVRRFYIAGSRKPE